MAERPGSTPEFPSATRISRTWWLLVGALIPLLLVVIFIAQNSEHVQIKFLWVKGNQSVGVALLAAAILGALTAVLIGAARIVQLRRQGRRASRASKND